MSESDQSDDKQNSAVGYGRPPVNRQFKPGQSGNPRGRPKGSKNLATMLAEALSRPVTVRDKKGKARTLTKQEVMIEGMTNKALVDEKAFLIIFQLADKYGVFKQQAEASYVAAQSGIKKWLQRLNEMRCTQEEEEARLRNELQNGTTTQPDPKMK
jgi:Family of unknown function (DUF5681)